MLTIFNLPIFFRPVLIARWALLLGLTLTLVTAGSSLGEAEQTNTVGDSAIVADKPIVYPDYDSLADSWKDDAVYAMRTLDNGMTVVVKSVAGLEEFMAVVALKDFAGTLGATNDSLANLVFRLLPLDSRLFLTGPQPLHSMLPLRQFLTPDSLADSAFREMSKSITNPEFDSARIDEVTAEVRAYQETACVEHTGQELTDLLKQLVSAPRTAHSLQIASENWSIPNLVRVHQTLFAPQRLVLIIVSGRDTSTMIDMANNTFGLCQPPEVRPAVSEETAPLPTEREITFDIVGDKVEVFVGGHLMMIDPQESLPLRLALAILDQRLSDDLIERRSVASRVETMMSGPIAPGWYYIATDIEPDYETAVLNALTLQVEKLTFDGPTVDEVARARFEMWQERSDLMKSQRGQAYILANDAISGQNIPYDSIMLRQLSEIGPATVRNVAMKYLRPELWIVSTAGPTR